MMGQCLCCEENDGVVPPSAIIPNTDSASAPSPAVLQPQLFVDRSKIFPTHVALLYLQSHFTFFIQHVHLQYFKGNSNI